MALFHYIPLHHSPAGKRFGKTPFPLPVTENLSEQIIRLPLWVGIPQSSQEYVVEKLSQLLSEY
jgi:dTDP-4-amino-4,6-dideoxygalactose transaminase